MVASDGGRGGICGDDAAVFRHAPRQHVRDPGAPVPGNSGDIAFDRCDDGTARLVCELCDPLCGTV